VTIEDSNGNVIPDYDLSLSVSVTGAGRLIGLGSADSNANLHGTEPEKFVDHKYSYQGMLKAFVQSTDSPGEITVSVSAKGLTSGSATITTVQEPATSVVTENKIHQ
jgi:beta-galactosidase